MLEAEDQKDQIEMPAQTTQRKKHEMSTSKKIDIFETPTSKKGDIFDTEKKINKSDGKVQDAALITSSLRRIRKNR